MRCEPTDKTLARVTSRKAPVGSCRLVVSRSRAVFRAAPPARTLVQVTGAAPRASIAARRDARDLRQRPIRRRRSLPPAVPSEHRKPLIHGSRRIFRR